jgi:hypothetical protein
MTRNKPEATKVPTTEQKPRNSAGSSALIIHTNKSSSILTARESQTESSNSERGTKISSPSGNNQPHTSKPNRANSILTGDSSPS